MHTTRRAIDSKKEEEQKKKFATIWFTTSTAVSTISFKTSWYSDIVDKVNWNFVRADRAWD